VIKHLFILIPADTPTGPVKGAYALANSLVNQCKVTLVTIRHGSVANAWLDPRVHTKCLADFSDKLPDKITYYRSLLREAGGRLSVASFSLCLSADFINILCKKYAFTWSSVRGNLLINYRYDYGIFGICLAVMHLFSLRWVDRVVAMNKSMAMQIKKFSGQSAEVIGNFIDEAQLSRIDFSKNDDEPIIFVFVGSLTSRKQPRLLIRALKDLKIRGITAYVEYVGTGSELKKIEDEVRKFDLIDFVKFHGFLQNPELIVIKADVLVLPSLSEGISRAAMEALYLGIPCVLRDAEGSLELLSDGVNGTVFKENRDLPDAMLRAVEISQKNKPRQCLLKSDFRQCFATKKYRYLMGINNE